MVPTFGSLSFLDFWLQTSALQNTTAWSFFLTSTQPSVLAWDKTSSSENNFPPPCIPKFPLQRSHTGWTRLDCSMAAFPTISQGRSISVSLCPARSALGFRGAASFASFCFSVMSLERQALSLNTVSNWFPQPTSCSCLSPPLTFPSLFSIFPMCRAMPGTQQTDWKCFRKQEGGRRCAHHFDVNTGSVLSLISPSTAWHPSVELDKCLPFWRRLLMHKLRELRHGLI